MEGDPFAVVESMTIAAFATGASQGYLYIRGEYPRGRGADPRRDRRRARGRLLGADILGSGFAFDIELRRGAGAYICGEETALFESIEGKRGEPRNKPPFPVEVGLFGKPTVVNNVETLVNIPLILEMRRRRGLCARSARRARPARSSSACRQRRAARRLRGRVRGDAARAHRARRRRRRAAANPGDPARRRGGRVRRAGRARHAAHLRGDARGRGDARLGRDHGLRRDRRPRRHAAADRPVLPRRVVRPVRPVPRRERPPGGAARAARGGLDASARATRSSSCSREIGQAMRDASICGLGQTASSAIESRVRGSRSWWRCERGHARPVDEPRPRARSAHAARRPGTRRPAADRDRPHARRPEPRRRRRRPRSSRRRRSSSRSTAPRSRCPAGSTILGACRAAGHRHADPVLRREPHAGQRLPRVRRRGHGLARPRAGLLAQGRGRDGGPDRLGAGPHVAQGRAGVPRARRSTCRWPARPCRTARSAATWSATARIRRASGRGRAGRGRRARRPRARATTTPPRATRRSRDRRAADEGRQRPLRPRLLEVHPLLQVRRGLRRGRPEHVRDRRRRARLRCPDLHRAGRAAARVGVRLLRQLHRRLPDRRADGQARVRHARGRHVGRVAPRP